MGRLHRTQVYLDEEQLHRLKLEAEKARVATSELIRRAIDDFLGTRAKRTDWDRDPLTRAIGKITLSVSDASRAHDHYLYGRRAPR